MFVQLLHHFWVFLFLLVSVCCVLLHMISVYLHESWDLVIVVRSLHCFLDILDELSNLTLSLLGCTLGSI